MRHPKQHCSIDKKFPHAEITGADNSDDMLAAARKENPGIEFIKLAAEKELKSIKNAMMLYFQTLVYSGFPHRKLLKNLFPLLNSGGTLAVQIPQQSKHPVHSIMKPLSKSGK